MNGFIIISEENAAIMILYPVGADGGCVSTVGLKRCGHGAKVSILIL